MNKILVAGGAGYIGSHICVELINEGYEPFVIDNLYNSSEVSLKRVAEITGKEVKFYNADFLDEEKISEIFDIEHPEAVIMQATKQSASLWQSRLSIITTISAALCWYVT